MTQDFTHNNEITDKNVLIETFFKTFPDYNTDESRERITKAWNYLCDKSGDTKRSCGKPFYLHPMRTACILAEIKMDTDTIVSGFLHDLNAIEGFDEKDIETVFGSSIYSILCGTTKITNIHIENKTLHQADSIRKMLFAMIDDVRVIFVKLADKLDRMRNLKNYDEKTQRAYASEALDIWAPLADRLGMSSAKNEFEDLSLKYSNPDTFQQIKSIVAQKKDERSDYLEKAVQSIYKAAVKAKIEVTITSRAKHFYSIYQKMRKRNVEPGSLYDLLALRVLCNTVPECYTLVGIVHSLWKPLDGRFKDYIAMPKANGYQSLHTTVMCGDRPLEIQIRTTEMHNIAEHGVASHWLYKKGMSHDTVDVNNLAIFNQLRELRTKQLTDESFFNQLKSDILGDEIFVFTPKGDVRQLPAGSNALDFAYAIHSAIGEKVVGAKADGKIIPLSTPLKNTQIIEVITNPQAHPTENQLKMVHTSKARQKIHAWLVANNPTFEEEVETAEVQLPKQPKKRIKNGSANAASKKGTGKIRIGNTTNFIVTFAQCCKPTYPDPIVGYVSRNRGITIHRADCYTFQRIPDIEHRMIEVEWDVTEEPSKKN
jgi:guanosine-3',5'-bis(diphosphate) 3'-pyrophosphohydrolase